MEGEKEQDEDDYYSYWYQQLQPGFGADLVLPLPGPGHIVAGRQLEVLLQHLLGFGDKAAHVTAAHVEEDQRAQQATLAVDLRSAGGYFELGDQRERNLSPLH